MFVEKELVSYREMYGTICFIGTNYVVIEIVPVSNRNSARLLVYRENYKDIITNKQSHK